jgi:hypothetical protein
VRSRRKRRVSPPARDSGKSCICTSLSPCAPPVIFIYKYIVFQFSSARFREKSLKRSQFLFQNAGFHPTTEVTGFLALIINI